MQAFDRFKRMVTEAEGSGRRAKAAVSIDEPLVQWALRGNRRVGKPDDGLNRVLSDALYLAGIRKLGAVAGLSACLLTGEREKRPVTGFEIAKSSGKKIWALHELPLLSPKLYVAHHDPILVTLEMHPHAAGVAARAERETGINKETLMYDGLRTLGAAAVLREPAHLVIGARKSLISDTELFVHSAVRHYYLDPAYQKYGPAPNL